MHILLYTRQWHPTPVLLPGKSHGRRSLVGSMGSLESDTTEQLPFHFSLSCIGEGNGNPLKCSCLENPRDRGASWAAVYGVAQSQTRLKRLSSSSSRLLIIPNTMWLLYSCHTWKNQVLLLGPFWNYFSKYFQSVVGWVHPYGGLTVCVKTFNNCVLNFTYKSSKTKTETFPLGWCLW